jgi:hypothetical protein
MFVAALDISHRFVVVRDQELAEQLFIAQSGFLFAIEPNPQMPGPNPHAVILAQPESLYWFFAFAIYLRGFCSWAVEDDGELSIA